MLKIGAHVSMSGKDMMLQSAKEAVSYGANTFMIYTGAAQNTKRKEISELKIEEAKKYMEQHDLTDIIVHAPYIINLGNAVKSETFEIATQFLAIELERTKAMGSNHLVLHPGAHVGEGKEIGAKQIIKGLNQVLEKNQTVFVTLETMAGKGTEIGRCFEELAIIYDGVVHNEKLRVCLDTCHLHDSGYDIIHHFDEVMEQFDRLIGKNQIAVIHINDSKNPVGAKKDRHENIGYGYIGFDALCNIVYYPDFKDIPKILETPYLTVEGHTKRTIPPYKEEIEMIRKRQFVDYKKNI